MARPRPARSRAPRLPRPPWAADRPAPERTDYDLYVWESPTGAPASGNVVGTSQRRQPTGASPIEVVTDAAEAKGRSPAVTHYSRILWLGIFGAIHYYLIWWGDILLHYALVALVAYFFRRFSLQGLVAANEELRAEVALLRAALAAREQGEAQ